MTTSAEIFGARILVVDDQEPNLILLEHMLADAGYTSVSCVADSRTVADLYRTEAYDAVLLDLNMPYMNGFEVIEALKAIEPESYLPVLVITAEPGHKLQALQAGAQDFIGKPFDHTEVLTRLRNMLTVRLLNKDLRASQATLQQRSAELSSSNRFLDSVIENIPNMVFVKDARDLRFVRVNRAFEEITGYSRQEIIGKTDLDLFPKEEAEFFQTADRETLDRMEIFPVSEESIGSRHRGTRILRTKKGPVCDDDGTPCHVLGISEDVTDRIKMEKEIRRLNMALTERADRLQASNDQQQAALNYVALYDILTGAPNRVHFLKTVDRMLQFHARNSRKLAIVVLDIRHFGRINDSFGKTQGDQLLTLIANRLVTGSQLDCARIGANTFAVVLSDFQVESEVGPALKKLVLEPLSQSFLLDDRDVTVATRCGIAMFPGDGETAEDLFGNGEAALRRAKAMNEEYLFYTSNLNARVAEQILLESALRKAVTERQFVLYYQPKIDTVSGRLTGFEALIRWNSPARGMVPPNEFIPILEDTGMILEVGKWVLQQAATDYRSWRKKGLNPPAIAVNVSAIQLRHPDFAETVFEMCENPDDTPVAIDLEITESVLMEDIDRIIPSLQKLRAAGYGIAIDDFGTGYSSFSYLTKIPLDAIKIDRTFIEALATEQRHNTIVSTIILLAHALKLRTIAEGVETESQRIELQRLGCDELQGYLLGRPMPEHEATKLLQRRLA